MFILEFVEWTYGKKKQKCRPSVLFVILQTLGKTAELIGLSVKEDWSTESGISAAL